MGLLKGFGRELKGLLHSGELADTFAEAQAYLEGDYRSAIKLAERDLARRRARREARAGPKRKRGGRECSAMRTRKARRCPTMFRPFKSLRRVGGGDAAELAT